MLETLHNPTDEQLALASERNMRSWYLLTVEAAGGDVQRRGGLAWGYVPGGLELAGTDRIVALPEAADDDAIADMVAYFSQRAARPWVTCGGASTPDEVRRRLKAWGFALQFAAVTMACRLDTVPAAFAVPDGLVIEPLRDPAIFDAHAHPYLGTIDSDVKRRTLAARMNTLHSWHFVALLDGVPVGGAMLTGADGVAGLYDVGVIPAMRRRGIASAVVAAACRYAREELGYEAAVLQNRAALVPLYQGVGFRRVSHIDHWERPLDAASLTADEAATLLPEQFVMAIQIESEAAALALLDLDPSLATARKLPSWGASLMHIAAWMGYTGLLEAALDRNYEVDAPDDDFGSTPLLWAVHGCCVGGDEVRREQLGAAERLLRAGADPNAVSRLGATALDMARQPGCEAMRDLLVRYGAEESDAPGEPSA